MDIYIPNNISIQIIRIKTVNVVLWAFINIDNITIIIPTTNPRQNPKPITAKKLNNPNKYP